VRALIFAGRNRKELMRDPLNFMFALGLPLVVMLLLVTISKNVPSEADIFPIAELAPGIAVFGLSFISLFSGMLIAKDRSSSFMMRLFASPLTGAEFIFGYILPLIPLSIGQSAICISAAVLFGMPFGANIFLLLLVLIPSALFYIAVGLLAGTVFNDKQVGGICGALLTNLSAWLSGTWFDLSLVGGWFKKAAYCLPFAHAVDAGRAALRGDYDMIAGHLIWVLGYAAAALIAAVVIFNRKMKNASM
jgi:ABC-2 type transport system permease protein